MTSEGAQGIFSKTTFFKSVHSNKKDEVCHSFIREISTKYLHRGGVNCLHGLDIYLVNVKTRDDGAIFCGLLRKAELYILIVCST